jgi:hypothetical protein
MSKGLVSKKSSKKEPAKSMKPGRKEAIRIPKTLKRFTY